MRTVREGKLGERVLRLVEKSGRFYGILIANGKVSPAIEGDVAEDVWRQLHDEASKADPSFFGFSGARAGFLRWMPDGFTSPEFHDHERDYKLTAKAKLDATLPSRRR